MGLVSNLIISPKFKVLELEKYNETTDPTAHIWIYRQKMAKYERNEKLLIHYFQDSLTRVTTQWYNELERTKIQT